MIRTKLGNITGPMPKAEQISFFGDLFRPLGDLCPKCSSIMDAILKEEGEKSLCNLGALTFHKNCSVCYLFRKLAQTITGGSEDAGIEAWSWMVPTNFLLMANTKGRGVEAGGDIGYFWIRHYNSNTPKPDNSRKCLDAHVRIRRAQDALGVAHYSMFRSKYPDPLPAIQDWLSSCLAHSHKSDWLRPNGLDESDHTRPKHIHLIDCTSLCVVKKEFRSDLNYAALSYVWGRVEQFMLCRSNYNELKGENSLGRRRLPDTIRDAMDLCSALHIPYIWIDSLCIIQDNLYDKYVHINNMDRIYQRAVLTIVSAAGNDANAGLPAFRYDSWCLNRGVATKGLYLYEFKNSWSSLSYSQPKWATRGWTFQEEALSTRILIFTEDAVFCRCSVASLFHDPLSKRLLDCACMDRQLSPGTLAVHEASYEGRRQPYLEFIEALGEYIKRELTSELDNINGFTGIIKALEPHLGSCWYGVPLRAFASCLQYESYGAPLKRVSNFPSWSWAGWKMNRGNFCISGVCSSTLFYRFDAAGLLECLPSKDFGWYGSESESTASFSMTEPTPAEVAQLGAFADSGIVRDRLVLFWAWELELKIAKNPNHSDDYEVLHPIESDTGKIVGNIRLEESWALGRLQEKQSFIVFAVTYPSELVQPMLIERIGRIAFRVNFMTPASYLPMSDWLDLKPERKLVALA